MEWIIEVGEKTKIRKKERWKEGDWAIQYKCEQFHMVNTGEIP
jgi:hypothetical protein